MKLSVVKLLWGRSGNRCAFPGCRELLTVEGESSTLGEMAHIVATSPDGPRGDYALSPDDRDGYPNLILLCPTDHTRIDGDPSKWTVDKLREIKSEHERWVKEQLELNKIVISPIDNETFLERQKKEWFDFSNNYIWVISSITPLNISEDIIDPLNPTLLEVLNNLRLSHGSWSSRPEPINIYNTTPNANGVINEELSYLHNGIGDRIQFFRNGHCEKLICIEWSLIDLSKRDPERFNHIKVIPYQSIVTCFIEQTSHLKDLWKSSLPFKDMLVTFAIANTKNTCLYSRNTDFRGPLVGSVVSKDFLEYKDVINRDFDTEELTDFTIKRFYNYFGLVGKELFNNQGKPVPPEPLIP